MYVLVHLRFKGAYKPYSIVDGDEHGDEHDRVYRLYSMWTNAQLGAVRFWPLPSRLSALSALLKITITTTSLSAPFQQQMIVD